MASPPRQYEPRVPPPIAVPPPGDPTELKPLLVTWSTGEILHRCYDVGWGSREFYAGDPSRPGRFHPFCPERPDAWLPVLYAADSVAGALSETVFHDVPTRGTKRVPYAQLRRRILIALVPTRDLTLVDLTSDGLRRLGLTRSELIESDPRSYPDTAAWARALHAHSPAVDGLTWVSRQQDTSRAVVLFGNRVAVTDLDVAPDTVPLALGAGEGLITASAAADRADITITGIADLIS